MAVFLGRTSNVGISDFLKESKKKLLGHIISGLSSSIFDPRLDSAFHFMVVIFSYSFLRTIWLNLSPSRNIESFWYPRFAISCSFMGFWWKYLFRIHIPRAKCCLIRKSSTVIFFTFSWKSDGNVFKIWSMISSSVENSIFPIFFTPILSVHTLFLSSCYFLV